MKKAKLPDLPKDKTFYIAGPMTGLPQFNYPAFHKTAKVMRELDLRVESPAEIKYPDHAKYPDFIKGGLQLLFLCDAILLLPGWQGSTGAQVERMVAEACCMDIYELDEGNLI